MCIMPRTKCFSRQTLSIWLCGTWRTERKEWRVSVAGFLTYRWKYSLIGFNICRRTATVPAKLWGITKQPVCGVYCVVSWERLSMTLTADGTHGKDNFKFWVLFFLSVNKAHKNGITSLTIHCKYKQLTLLYTQLTEDGKSFFFAACRLPQTSCLTSLILCRFCSWATDFTL